MLLHQAHSSEALALGAALLRMNAAEALHPLFLAGVSGTMQPLAAAVTMQVQMIERGGGGGAVWICVVCLCGGHGGDNWSVLEIVWWWWWW